ncbi:sortase [Streptomyces sp. NPDC019208]|uniref:sortase domain-containing protein n=1 Tax=unclassified Streptomyces TaxID=2593676 RepID=UPI0033F5C865
MGTPRAGHRTTLGAAAALVGILLSGAAILFAVRPDESSSARDFGSSDPGTTTSVTAQPQSPAAVRPQPAQPASRSGAPGALAPPSELSIPRLELRAPVEAVGVAGDGQMQVPEDPDRVGWYRFSPVPGAGEGSSVIVGHVDAEGRGVGVLVGLNEVRKGDTVEVRRKDGGTVAYRITARRTVSKTALADSGAFRRDGRPVLTLITCAGPYLPDDGGYQNNLVVTAVEVTQ